MDERKRVKLIVGFMLILSLLLSSISLADEKVTGSGFFSPSGKTETNLAYQLAICMKSNKDRLYVRGDKIFYRSIEIDSDEAEYCDSGAIYRSLSTKVQDFVSRGKSNYDSFDNELFDTLFNIDKPSSYKEAKPYFIKIKDLFVKGDGSKGLFAGLENAECVTGTFDFEKRYAEFEIPDTLKLSEELGISKEALGYFLAVFDDYAADVQFNGNQCKVLCNPLPDR